MNDTTAFIGLSYSHTSFNFGGNGVKEDSKKALEYYQRAADLGDPCCFFVIGLFHFEKGEIEEGMLNLRKSAICGLSQKEGVPLFTDLRNGLKLGYITKEEYDFTQKENQTAINEMKSDARERYAELKRKHGDE